MAGEVESSKITRKYFSFWTIFVFVTCFIIILTGCTTTQSTTGFNETVSSEQKKVELKKKLDRRYEDSQTHYLLGQLYHADRIWGDAEFYYNNALRFDPVYRPAQAGMIKLCIDRGDKLKAQHYLEIYMNQAGEMPDKLVDLGTEFQQQGLDAYALTCFNKALEIAPKSAKVHKSLGYYYLNKNDKDKAREHFENSFNIDRSQGDVARELGLLDVPIIYQGKSPKTDESNK